MVGPPLVVYAGGEPLIAVVGDYGMQVCPDAKGQTDQYGQCGRASVARTLERIFRDQLSGSPWRRGKVVSLTGAGWPATQWTNPLTEIECPPSLTPDSRFPFSGVRKQACDSGVSLKDSIVTYLGEVPDYVLISFSSDNYLFVTPTEEVDAIEAIANTLETAGAEVLISTPLLEDLSGSMFPWREQVATELRSRGLVNGPDFMLVPLPRYDVQYLSPEGATAVAYLWWAKLQPQLVY